MTGHIKQASRATREARAHSSVAPARPSDMTVCGTALARSRDADIVAAPRSRARNAIQTSCEPVTHSCAVRTARVAPILRARRLRVTDLREVRAPHRPSPRAPRQIARPCLAQAREMYRMQHEGVQPKQTTNQARSGRRRMGALFSLSLSTATDRRAAAGPRGPPP